MAEQRNAVLIGGTGTGKSHLAIAIARACIRGGARGRFYTVVDLVNRLESEARASRQGRLAEYLTRKAGRNAASTRFSSPSGMAAPAKPSFVSELVSQAAKSGWPTRSWYSVGTR